MIEAVKNMREAGYFYTSVFLINLAVFAVIYKLFGFEWFLVVAVADITRDLGIIVVSRFDKNLSQTKGGKE